MGRKVLCIWCLLVLVLGLSGCSAGKDRMEKVRDIEFTVVNPDEIPKELSEVIAEKQDEGFQLTYGDKGYLYMAYGYGKRDTSGYSVEVEECYETEDVVRMKTNLLGPAKDEEIIEESTYPYVVVKAEFVDKDVIFE